MKKVLELKDLHFPYLFSTCQKFTKNVDILILKLFHKNYFSEKSLLLWFFFKIVQLYYCNKWFCLSHFIETSRCLNCWGSRFILRCLCLDKEAEKAIDVNGLTRCKLAVIFESANWLSIFGWILLLPWSYLTVAQTSTFFWFCAFLSNLWHFEVGSKDFGKCVLLWAARGCI